MEASPWNLCVQPIQPIILSKSSDSIANDAQMSMTPLMLDALNSSPNSIDNEKQFVIPQRRVYETTYLNSVQGSTSTPNSVGHSSGTASPDNSTQLTSDSSSFPHFNDPKWADRAVDNLQTQEKSYSYCYVFHGQPPSGSRSTMSDSALIVANSSAHSAITVPASSLVPTSNFTSLQPAQSLLTAAGSPHQTNSLPAPSNPSSLERSSSVPPHPLNQELKTDFSALDTNQKETKPKKSKKRKAPTTTAEANQPAKKPATNQPFKGTSRPTISALTRRRLKTAGKSEEPLEKMNLLLTELTVEDLKIICRKYNLPISGTKSDLLRRLQPMEDQIDVEGILLEAMQEEDLRLNEEKAREAENGIQMDVNRTFVPNKLNLLKTVPPPIDVNPVVKIPITTYNGSNQFDVAISNYLRQHRKQFNQQQSHTVSLKPATECMDGNCSCVHQAAKNGTFPTTKTIYLTPSTVINGAASKTTVIRVPIATFNPAIDSAAVSSSVLSKKLCKLDNSQCNGSATTFCYAEAGSGGQFTLETSPPLKSTEPTANLPKFVQISVPSTFCTGGGVRDVHEMVSACLKCKKNIPKELDGADELQTLINELSLSQINNSIENSTLTARILALHQQIIKAQYSRLYQMSRQIAESQKVLNCQQEKIEKARKAMQKIKAQRPASIDTILKKLDISQLSEQHNRQTNELKLIQENHQQLKGEQEKLAKLEFQLQEEMSIEQAVEDVVRLIKTNRKTALLIVQLIHKFQCDRIREFGGGLTGGGDKKQEVNEKNSSPECNADQYSPNKEQQRSSIEISTPTVVTLDESDDECGHGHSHSRQNPEQKEIKESTPKATTRNSSKKKSKAAKQSKKPPAQHSEHTFEAVMEDIFSTVISSDVPVNESSSNEVPEKLAILVENEEKPQKAAKKTTAPRTLTGKIEKSVAINSFRCDEINSNGGLVQQPHKFETSNENNTSADHSFNHPNGCTADQTPTLYNYMASTALTKSEINTVYTVNSGGGYNQQPPYSDSRIGNAAYHQRRAFLQQRRQTLYEQLEQIERQQLHNEMQNSCVYNSINIDIDEELTNLGDLNVEDLYNYDFDQLEVPPTPVDDAPAALQFNSCPPPSNYLTPYHSSLNTGFPHTNQQHPVHHQQQRQYSDRTFQQTNSIDIDDVLDLIHNGEKNRQPSTDFEDGVQATNAIYHDLRLNDIDDEMNWNDPMTSNEEVATKQQIVVNES